MDKATVEALLTSIISGGAVKSNEIEDSEFRSSVTRYSLQEILQLLNKLEDMEEKEKLASSGCLVACVGRQR